MFLRASPLTSPRERAGEQGVGYVHGKSLARNGYPENAVGVLKTNC
jgi:hypothetical protein